MINIPYKEVVDILMYITLEIYSNIVYVVQVLLKFSKNLREVN